MTKSVLVVDDDPDTRAVLSEFLGAHGFVVHAARDGRHALQVLGHIGLPDLILLDYLMPVMNGSHFLARKRRNPRLRPIPVVLLSAWTRAWSARGRDAVEVLSKPVDPQRLLALVKRICEGQAPVSSPARATDRIRARTGIAASV
ncbi:MAG TPA: response regulator [Gemmatimonadales bacterium]|nr:response regulator [Gemmatimonadales bacterium]